jgi:hypothetical protein
MSKFLSARFALYSVGLVLAASSAFGFARLSRDDAAFSRSSTRLRDPRQAMVAELAASRPHPSLGDESKVFERLVGIWDCDFGFPNNDGTVTHRKGEILFGWVMDGHAIQDLWIGYPTGPGKERTIGTTIRFFDTAQKQWRIVFVGPQNNYLVTAQGGAEDDRIVLRGVDTDGIPIRWTFSEITLNSFHWQGAKSHDGGKSWKIDEDHHMTRRA